MPPLLESPEFESGTGWPRWAEAVTRSLAEKRITVNAAAERLGVRNNTLQNWLRGTVQPRLTLLPVIAELTGISHAMQLELGGVLPSQLAADAHSIQVAEDLRRAVDAVSGLAAKAAELAFADAGAKLASVLLSAEGSNLQVTLRRVYRGRRFSRHLSTYVGLQDISRDSGDVQELRERVMRIVGESAAAFGARWREQEPHDWVQARPTLILNVPQHERPRIAADAPLAATPSILMLGCPYAHAEFIGAILADSLGYGYIDIRYSVPLPLDKAPTDASVTDARTSFTRRLIRSPELTRKNIWSITDHRVIPQVLSELPESDIACAVYVRSDDAILKRGSEVWNVPYDEMLTLRESLDKLTEQAGWPAVVVELSDDLLLDPVSMNVEADSVADASMLGAIDVWRTLHRFGRVPGPGRALGNIRDAFDPDGRLKEVRPSLVRRQLRLKV